MGYLVYERYWQDAAAGDGQSSFSVTKSSISALVGIALGDGKLKGLDQTVEELLAPTSHLPPTRGCAGSRSRSCWPPTRAQVAAYERAPVAWPRDPQGYHLGDSLLRLPASDLAKLGYLYLNGGRWGGTQVVPAVAS